MAVFPPPGSEDMVAEQQLSSSSIHIQLGIRCGPGGVISPEPCVVAHDTPLLIRGMKVTLREDVPPSSYSREALCSRVGPRVACGP